jgi:tetratricopeptide (TPR) repeat protein
MAIMLDPDSAEAYEYRGRIFHKLGKDEMSIVDFTKAIELTPNRGWLFYSRGYAFANKDNNRLALSDFEKAIDLDPDYSKSAGYYSIRGLVRSRIGDYEKGIEDCKKAVQLDTNNPAALNNLAWLLAIAPQAKLRDGKMAVEYAKRACELSNWKEAYFLGTLAAAYAEAGNFEEAVKWEKKSIFSHLPEKEMGLAHEMLNLFEKGKPYHAEK